MYPADVKAMKFFKIMGLGLLLCLTSLHETQGKPGGSVLVRLYLLENLDSAICSPCDYQLSIWVTCDGKITDSSCLYGEGKTGIFYHKSSIVFSQDLGNETYNPLKFNFTLFQGNLGISILATNPTTSSTIAHYQFHKPTYPTPYGKKNWTNTTLIDKGKSKSEIKLSYQIYCKEHYYGPSCSVGCFPGPNYNCDPKTGMKLCINGYIGPNCTCKPGLIYNCDPTGKKICYPPWYGLECDVKCQPRNNKWTGYTCDSKSGRKICLSGWYGPECNETTPVMSRLLPSYSLTSRTTSSEKISHTILTANSKGNILTQIQISSNTLPLVTSPDMTSSSNTLPLVTSPDMTSPSNTPPLMTSQDMTSSTKTKFMTSSQRLPSYVFSSLRESQISRNNIASMINQNRSEQTEDVYLQTTILVTNYPVTSSTVTEISEKTNNISGMIMDRTVISRDRTREAIEDTKKLEKTSVSRTRQSDSLPKTMRPRISVTWTHPDTTYYNEPKTEPSSIITTNTAVHKGRESTRNIISRIERDWSSDWVTSTSIPDPDSTYYNEPKIEPSTPTPRDTTFKPGVPEARTNKNLWWILLILFIFAILLIIAGIVIYKKKNRKRFQISPHYEASMQDMKELKASNNIDNKSIYNEQEPGNINNNNKSSEKDLEAIWKVMSTFHE